MAKELKDGDPFAMEYLCEKLNNMSEIQPRLAIVYWRSLYVPLLFMPKASDWRRVRGDKKQVELAYHEALQMIAENWPDICGEAAVKYTGKKKIKSEKLIEKLESATKPFVTVSATASESVLDEANDADAGADTAAAYVTLYIAL